MASPSNDDLWLILHSSLLTTSFVVFYLFTVLDKSTRRHSHRPSIRENGKARKKRIANINRQRSLLNRKKLQDLPEHIFSSGFRMSRNVFEQLLALLEPLLLQPQKRKRRFPKNFRKYDRHIDPYIALAFSLRWLAGGQRWDLLYMFDVGKTTLHVWTWRVIRAINHVLRDNIVFPTTASALDSLAAGFNNIAGGMGAAIPNTVCAFDGVCIQKCPPPQAKVSPDEGVFVAPIIKLQVGI